MRLSAAKQHTRGGLGLGSACDCSCGRMWRPGQAAGGAADAPGPDGDLRLGKQPLHGHGEDVRALRASGSRARVSAAQRAGRGLRRLEACALAASCACMSRTAVARQPGRGGAGVARARERGRAVWRMRSSVSDSSLVGSSMREKSTGAAVSAAEAGSATAEVRSRRCDAAASARGTGTAARSGGGSLSAAIAAGDRPAAPCPAAPQRPAGGSDACGARRLPTADTETAADGCARRSRRRSAPARMAQPCVPHCMRLDGGGSFDGCAPPAARPLFASLRRFCGARLAVARPPPCSAAPWPCASRRGLAAPACAQPAACLPCWHVRRPLALRRDAPCSRGTRRRPRWRRWRRGVRRLRRAWPCQPPLPLALRRCRFSPGACAARSARATRHGAL